MRATEIPIHYLVGTPKGRLSRLEPAFLERRWEQVRPSVQVKLLEQGGEVYVPAKSAERVNKERAMRRRRVKKLWRRLGDLRRQKLSRDQLLLKLGAAKKEAGRAYGLVEIQLPGKDQAVSPETFTYRLRALAPGRYARAVFDKLEAMQMVDVHLPTPTAAISCCRAIPSRTMISRSSCNS